jgi:hypothetical protein
VAYAAGFRSSEFLRDLRASRFGVPADLIDHLPQLSGTVQLEPQRERLAAARKSSRTVFLCNAKPGMRQNAYRVKCVAPRRVPRTFVGRRKRLGRGQQVL